MLRTLSVTVMLLFTGGPLMAGGHPRLCLPIDGVTAENAEECTHLVLSALERPLGDDEQWYLRVFFSRALILTQTEDALADSQLPFPHERLGLLGHFILEIDADTEMRDMLLADLAGRRIRGGCRVKYH